MAKEAIVHGKAMVFVVGSTRAPKVGAARLFLMEYGALLAPNHLWWDMLTREVPSGVRETPIGRGEIMNGAYNRVHALLTQRPKSYDCYFIGLEGGIDIFQQASGQQLAFLENWAYVSDGEVGYFGNGGSIAVPDEIAEEVIRKGRSLAEVIDQVAGKSDTRSGEGAWGFLTGGCISREQIFYRALANAFAPFYSGRAKSGFK